MLESKQRQTKGEGGQYSGILSEHIFWMSPYEGFKQANLFYEYNGEKPVTNKTFWKINLIATHQSWNSSMQLLFLSYCCLPVYSEVEINKNIENLKANALVSSRAKFYKPEKQTF